MTKYTEEEVAWATRLFQKSQQGEFTHEQWEKIVDEDFATPAIVAKNVLDGSFRQMFSQRKEAIHQRTTGDKMKTFDEIRTIIKSLQRTEHYECADCFYSCELHPSYCGDSVHRECTCGLEKHSAKLAKLLSLVDYLEKIDAK